MRRHRPSLIALVVLLLSLTGCGDTVAGGADGDDKPPLRVPVGPTTWDASAPAWFVDGTLHVGDEAVPLPGVVDRFVVAPTGVYWQRGELLMFTSAEGDTRRVDDVGAADLAISADRSVVAFVDATRGPVDRYGTHVAHLVVADTRTGRIRYRTPDEAPPKGADLADLYEETSPFLAGVAADRAFFRGTTVTLADGSMKQQTTDPDGVGQYVGLADTRFTDGYHVGISGDGPTRRVETSSAFAVGRLSPDRRLLLDQTMGTPAAVVYDAATGRQRRLGSPWGTFALTAWVDDDTFYGVASKVVDPRTEGRVVAQQVVMCEQATLRCTPVSPVLDFHDTYESGQQPNLLMETSGTGR